MLDQITFLDRCRHAHLHPDFPRVELEQIFSTSDADDRLHPVQELVDFVLTYFRGLSELPEEIIDAIPGALILVEQCLRDLAHLQSEVDHARLLALRGGLLQSQAYTGPLYLSNERLSEAAKCFEHAVTLLPSTGPPSALKRHFAWLAANIKVELQDDIESAGGLFGVALTGSTQWTSAGLYFQCATRLLRLDSYIINQVLRSVYPDLIKAWCEIPAVRYLDHRQKIKRIDPPAGEPRITHDQMLSLDDDQLLWFPHDRLGICTLLYCACDDSKKRKLYKQEALSLLSCFHQGDPQEFGRLGIIQHALED